jgi:hypothetical protein
VGVQRYPNLPERANQLRGCVNDARAMEAALKKYGFAVRLLVNEAATKQGILATLRQERATVRPNERFVFYFAGHGTDAPKPSLLPHDALETSADKHLTRDELYQAMAALPAYSRTVLLDSCFSGGMAKSLDRLQRERPHARPRYYPAGGAAGGGGARSPVPVPVNNQDTNQNLVGGAGAGGSGGGGGASTPVCYYVASLGNEKAMEDNFNGTYHGVFTYFLTAKLDGDRDLWKNIHTTVKGKVADFLFDGQHPTLSPSPFLQAPVFEAEKPATSPPPIVKPSAPVTAWDTYNSDYADPARVSLAMEPNKSPVAIGEQFRFAATVGADGYLVILERDVEGKVYVLFPKNGEADRARVRASQVVRIPENVGSAYSPDTPGTEYVKAILFTGRDKAAALLAALGKGGATDGVPVTGMKKLQEVPVKAAPFYTSAIAFEVVEK